MTTYIYDPKVIQTHYKDMATAYEVVLTICALLDSPKLKMLMVAAKLRMEMATSIAANPPVKISQKTIDGDLLDALKGRLELADYALHYRGLKESQMTVDPKEVRAEYKEIKAFYSTLHQKYTSLSQINNSTEILNQVRFTKLKEEMAKAKISNPNNTSEKELLNDLIELSQTKIKYEEDLDANHLFFSPSDDYTIAELCQAMTASNDQTTKTDHTLDNTNELTVTYDDTILTESGITTNHTEVQ